MDQRASITLFDFVSPTLGFYTSIFRYTLKFFFLNIDNSFLRIKLSKPASKPIIFDRARCSQSIGYGEPSDSHW